MSDSMLPADRSYTVAHEWVDVAPGAVLPDTPVRVGITALAVEALGELVFVDLPEPGAIVNAGESCGEVESTKTVSELIAPVTGRVEQINSAVVEDPSLIGADPYGAGWLFPVLAEDAGELLTAAEYANQNGRQS
jgi:glycine cleavage system H protein